jgi:hypothetical protein
VLTYFTALDQLARALVRQWHGSIQIFETTQAMPQELLEPLLHAFGRSFRPMPNALDQSILAQYAGRYARVADGSAPEQLRVEVANEQLRVNTYWPIGAALIAVEQDTFRLEATDRWIIFVRDSAGQIAGLRYWLSQHEHAYHRLQGADAEN